jgi:ADP-ribose pyrophosphatase YjhB (NUDIX family)
VSADAIAGLLSRGRRARQEEEAVITCRFEDGSPAALRHAVVHAIVEREGALLLVKRAPHLSEGGMWGLPGGFLDRDETLAEGVVRELREETGWDGRVVALLRINSRPDRPREDRQNVAFDFLVEPLAKVGEPDAESSLVDWIPISALPALDTLAFDHGDSVRAYLRSRGRSGPPTLL